MNLERQKAEVNRAEIVNRLIAAGRKILESPKEASFAFTKNDAANQLLNDIDRFPHAFVIACIMDRQVTAERAWIIPYLICQKLGTFEFDILSRLNDHKYPS